MLDPLNNSPLWGVDHQLFMLKLMALHKLCISMRYPEPLPIAMKPFLELLKLLGLLAVPGPQGEGVGCAAVGGREAQGTAGQLEHHLEDDMALGVGDARCFRHDMT